MNGPGKYDAACTLAFQTTKANAVLLIVIGGEHGSGFSAQMVAPEFAERIPDILREVALQIEATPQDQKQPQKQTNNHHTHATH